MVAEEVGERYRREVAEVEVEVHWVAAPNSLEGVVPRVGVVEVGQYCCASEGGEGPKMGGAQTVASEGVEAQRQLVEQSGSDLYLSVVLVLKEGLDLEEVEVRCWDYGPLETGEAPQI